MLIVLRVFKKNIERFIRNLTQFYDKCKSWLKNLTPPPHTHTYSLRWCRTPSTFENWWKVTAIYPMIFLLFSHNYSKYRTLWSKWITSVRAWIFKCSRKFYAYNCFDLYALRWFLQGQCCDSDNDCPQYYCCVRPVRGRRAIGCGSGTCTRFGAPGESKNTTKQNRSAIYIISV